MATEKPEPDIYVGLLFVAVAALITGCIFLAIELNRYEWKLPNSNVTPPVSTTKLV